MNGSMTDTYGAVRILRIAIYNLVNRMQHKQLREWLIMAFFSLFPLLLFLVVGASYILEVQSAYDYVIENVYRVLTNRQNLIDANLQQVLDSRGAVGLLGLIGFLMVEHQFFFNPDAKISIVANPNSTKRGFFEDRVVALGMIGLLALLLGLSFISNTITGVLPKMNILCNRWKTNSRNDRLALFYKIDSILDHIIAD